MSQEWPTWNGMVTDAVTQLDDAQHDVDVALEWLDPDRSNGHGPDVEANREQAAQLLGDAQQLIDQAKDKLKSAAALRVV